MSHVFEERFIQYLQNLQTDRGKMATLRKGLIESQAQATWALLSRFVDFDRPYQIKTIQTVAGLFAHHSKTADHGNIGSLCFQLLDSDEKQKLASGESGTISRNFQYALAANNDEILLRVRKLIFRAKANEKVIGVNYVQLTADLLAWNNSFKKEKIKLAWGKEFWKVYADIDSDEAAEVVNND
ncbi:MAG: type I-E CRISPR-associated protein Cse2/CasB [Methylomonas sp.]|jgi:CRISPR type I-E-associated protein CasB/Cse2|uniref:type I-E CRISPR-associated protein Cse2/CasB n=1 Tax=Methylomonas sp. TaxID=418 RepID=UPI0025F6DCD7|nr:type I-E CRISPR-associated protein Cse2/CasB [Methylomonas sp.]MCK9609137.1 type I-E CRISPR-associated protein Cse2/CasB [Methylomonas sp.]